MRNLLSIELSNVNQNGVLNAAEANEVILLIHPLSSQKSGFKLTGTASGGASVTSDELTLENDLITFVVPFEWYSAIGDLVLVLESNEGNSDSFTITSTVTFTEEDNVKVRWNDDVFIISKQKSGSSTETRTLLWSNPTPTTARGQFNATLSEPIDNFDYMEIEYCYGTQTIIKSTVRTPVFLEDGTTYTFASGNTHLRGFIGMANASGTLYARRYYVPESTTVAFTTAMIPNQAGTATAPAIPLAIYGIKTSGSSEGSVTASLVTVGSKSNTTSPYHMTVTIPDDIQDGLVILSATRDSSQPVTSVTISSGSAVLEREEHGKYSYTNAYVNVCSVRIRNVSAGSTLTCIRSTSSANFYIYFVYKFS